MQGPGDELGAQLKRSLLNVLVLDQDAQAAVRESRRPSGELLDRLSAQIDLSLLTPYETSKPVTGSRFFGREFESGASCRARTATSRSWASGASVRRR